MTRSMCFFFLLLATAVSLFAQLTGQVSGSVADPTGAAIAGAKVGLYLPGGKTALLSTTTNDHGLFDFTAVRPDLYVLNVESPGFSRVSIADVKVDPARRVSLAPITLNLASASQTVEVTANTQGVETATAEVATTVSQAQISNLPVIGRQISNLFVTQAGVTQNLRQNTVINGMRPSFSNLMLDGVNIQDSVRTNNLDLIPNRLTIAQVAEFTVSTTNSSPTIGGAASTITLVTPSGTNQTHGSLYWYNRNRYFSSNDWFNNRNGLPKPPTRQHAFGGVGVGFGWGLRCRHGG